MIRRFGFSLIIVLLVHESKCLPSKLHADDGVLGSNEEIKNGNDYGDLSLEDIFTKGIKYYLFTRETGDSSYTQIEYGNLSSLTASTFDFSKTTKIVVHGWPDSAFGDFQKSTRKAYLSSSSLVDVNVIAVDWSLLTLLAKTAFKPVAKHVAATVDWMVNDAGVSLDLVHVMGHSVGAQIAGMIGEYVTVGKVARIIGLDPASGFGSSTTGRLDPSDAQFVDVIHTCGGLYSYFEPCGHVDFYPNKGHYNQPGCIIDFGLCSHLRAYRLFTESVSSEAFVSRACDSWKHYVAGDCDNNATAIMGEMVDTSLRGKFYLDTASSSPYALGNDTATSYE